VLTKGDRIFLAGHRGLVGSGILRRLQADGFENVVVRTRQELDLSDQAAVYAFLREERPDHVIVAAAKVGGMKANNDFPADFIGQNLVIQSNLIWGSHLADVPNLVFLGSSCIYPREAPQPLKEEALLTGPLEPTNAPYAVAKIAGLVLCDSLRRQYGRCYFSVMPPNIYGPNDNFDLQTSHVLPALIRKFHEALPDRPVECWGTGRPTREFLHVDDVADAVLFLMEQPSVQGHVNIGTEQAITIRDLAHTVQRAVGHAGPVHWNTAYPDGFPAKTMALGRLHELGWRPKIALEEGIRDTYRWFLANKA
jgi:GDP-L-fucose synthase